MLNNNDVQLFYKLLDSLSTSLRDLAVKYELIVTASTRETGEREKLNSSVVAMARECSLSFSAMAKDLQQLRELASEGRECDSQLMLSVQSLAKTVESIDVKMTATLRDASAAKTTSAEGKDVAVHIDSHMDKFGNQLTDIQSVKNEITRMVNAVEEMKKQFEPFSKLAVLLSKPAMIIVGVYFVVTMIMATISGCEKVDKIKEWIWGKTPTNSPTAFQKP
jgi:methyl-accepting chemotaxis protein